MTRCLAAAPSHRGLILHCSLSNLSKKPRPVTSAIEPIVREILEKDRLVKKNKQKHTAARIHTRLVEEYGIRCSERTVRRVVADLKREMQLAEKEVYLPLEFGYGEVAEFDWSEVEVVMAD